MSTVVPTTGWSSTIPLTAGARFSYTAVPGTGGSLRIQWYDGTQWNDFTNSNITQVTTSLVPAAATKLRGQAFVSAGTLQETREPFAGAVSTLTVPIFNEDLVSTPPELIANTTALYELQSTNALYRSNGTTLEVVGAGGAGGGNSGLSFGSDPTAVGANGTPYTVDGLPLIMTYNGDESLASSNFELSGAADLLRTVSYTDGFPTFSGVIWTADGWLMTTAQMKALNDEFLLSAGAAARGLRIAVDDLAYEINAAGVQTYTRCSFVWDGRQIRAARGVRVRTIQQASSSSSAVISAALRTLSLPGWLLGLSNVMRSTHWAKAVYTGSTGAGTLRANQLVNGTDHANTTGPSAATTFFRSVVDIEQLAASSQLVTASVQAAASASGGSSTSNERSIATASTDITVQYCVTTPTYVVTTNEATATLLSATLELLP